MNELCNLLKSMFPAIDFDKENSLVEDGLLDSLALFTLIGALEREYKISIPMEELSAENFNSLASIHRLTRRLIKQ